MVRGCSFLYVDHLDVRFGGDRTIRIENSSDVVLDHLRVWAANEGIRLTDGATGHVIEYAGEAVRRLSMEGRMTLCNMSIEAGARAGMIAPDETTFEVQNLQEG